ncbi:hypothetical protein GGI04_005102, partial [Coemansia thaxteri]
MKVKISEIPESSFGLFPAGTLETARKLYPDQDFTLIYLSSEGISVTNYRTVSKIRRVTDLKIMNEHNVLNELSSRELEFDVPRVVEFGENEFGCIYLTTEYLVGETLDELLMSDISDSSAFIDNLLDNIRKARIQISDLFHADSQ